MFGLLGERPQHCSAATHIMASVPTPPPFEAVPLLRMAEEAVPYGSAMVLLVSAIAGAIIIGSWAQPTMQPRGGADGEASAKAEGGKRRRAAECALAVMPDGSYDRADRVWRRELTPERYAALRCAEADPPNLCASDGGIDDIDADGIFQCAGCGKEVYDNDCRFEAGCGWPCFFTCLEGAVRERKDADGTRMELICNACNSHLGHIFRGEGWPLPPPAERHCVNGRSLRFVPAPEGTAVAVDETDLDDIDGHGETLSLHDDVE